MINIVTAGNTCIIDNLEISSNINLGIKDFVKFNVYDNTSSDSLLNSNCKVSFFNFNNESMSNSLNYFSDVNGFISVPESFNDNNWEIGYDYYVKVSCYCNNETCKLALNNSLTDYQTCTEQISFNVTNDSRYDSDEQWNNLWIFGIIFILGLIFIYFSNEYEENFGVSLCFSSIAVALFIILGSMMAFGFKLVMNNVSKSSLLNNSIMFLCFIIAFYCIFFSKSLFNYNKRQREEMVKLDIERQSRF
jgi:hypothetical protein